MNAASSGHHLSKHFERRRDGFATDALAADVAVAHGLMEDRLVLASNGEMDEAIGMARQMGAKNSPKLKVRFAPEWLSFLDAVWGDYWVLDLDPAYQLVAVGEPSREYLWVLSRTPTVPAPEYQALLRRLEAQGFDVRKLEVTRQSR